MSKKTSPIALEDTWSWMSQKKLLLSEVPIGEVITIGKKEYPVVEIPEEDQEALLKRYGVGRNTTTKTYF